MMFRTRTRKIWREIFSRKTQSALVTGSIFTGVLAVVMLFSIGQIVDEGYKQDIDLERMPMLRAMVAPNSPTPIDNAESLAAVRRLEGVAAAQGIAHYPAFWRQPGRQEENEAYLFTYTTPLEAVPLEPPVLKQGRFPRTGEQEIAVELRFAEKHHLEPGDSLRFRMLGDGEGEESWTVSGVVFLPYKYMKGVDPLIIPGETMVFAQYADAQRITGFSGLNIMQVRFDDFATAEAAGSDFKKTLVSQTPYVPVAMVIEDPAQNSYIKSVESSVVTLNMLGGVALLIAGFLVFNVINALVFEQRRLIGTMKSIGATGWDNVVMYGGLALVYGLLGGVPAVALGVPLGYMAAEAMAPLLDIYLAGFTIAPMAVVLGILLSLLVPLLAALPAVIASNQVTIMEAITDRGITASYNPTGASARFLSRLPFPTSIQQALRNIVLKKGRLSLTVVTLALAAGAFMGIFSVFDTLLQVQDIIQTTFGNDISITTATSQDQAQVATIIEQDIPGVLSVEPGVNVAIEVEGFVPDPVAAAPPTLFGFGINTHNPAIVDFHLLEGDAWHGDAERDGVVITRGIADPLDKKVGDSITVRSGNRQADFRIIGISAYPFHVVWFRWQTLAELGGLTVDVPTPNRYQSTLQLNAGDTPIAALGIDETIAPLMVITEGEFLHPNSEEVLISQALAGQYDLHPDDTLTLTAANGQSGSFTVRGVVPIPPEMLGNHPSGLGIALYWEELAALEGRPLTGDPRPNTLDVLLAEEGLSGAEVKEKIDEINGHLVEAGITATFSNRAETAEYIGQVVTNGLFIMNLGVALIATVGAMGLLSSLSMSVFERQKEIGVMRSIGATSATVAGQFLTEGLLIGVIAWLLGIPLSYLLYRALLVAFNFSEAMGFAYRFSTVLVGLGAMLLVAALASLWPSLSAARKTVANILRYQ